MIVILLAQLTFAAQQLGDVQVVPPEPRIFEPLSPIDDAVLLDFVRQPFDSMTDEASWPQTLGTHHGVPVIVSYACSDVCPDHTKRVVRYNLVPGPECERAGGLAKDIAMPSGIGTELWRYCIPALTARYQE